MSLMPLLFKIFLRDSEKPITGMKNKRSLYIIMQQREQSQNHTDSMLSKIK